MNAFAHERITESAFAWYLNLLISVKRQEMFFSRWMKNHDKILCITVCEAVWKRRKKKWSLLLEIKLLLVVYFRINFRKLDRPVAFKKCKSKRIRCKWLHIDPMWSVMFDPTWVIQRKIFQLILVVRLARGSWIHYYFFTWSNCLW